MLIFIKNLNKSLILIVDFVCLTGNLSFLLQAYKFIYTSFFSGNIYMICIKGHFLLKNVYKILYYMLGRVGKLYGDFITF